MPVNAAEKKDALKLWRSCLKAWIEERDAQLASDRVAMVAPSIAANKTAPYVDAADFIEAMAKPKTLEIAND